MTIASTHRLTVPLCPHCDEEGRTEPATHNVDIKLPGINREDEYDDYYMRFGPPLCYAHAKRVTDYINTASTQEQP